MYQECQTLTVCLYIYMYIGVYSDGAIDRCLLLNPTRKWCKNYTYRHFYVVVHVKGGSSRSLIVLLRHWKLFKSGICPLRRDDVTILIKKPLTRGIISQVEYCSRYYTLRFSALYWYETYRFVLKNVFLIREFRVSLDHCTEEINKRIIVIIYADSFVIWH